MAPPRGASGCIPAILSRRALASLLLLALCVAAPAVAQTVIVPDQFPTIQLALNSGAKEILVRPGTYLERPVISNLFSNTFDDVSLRGLVAPGTSLESLPVVAGLDFNTLVGFYTHTPSITITDLRFSGSVRNGFSNNPYSNPLVITFSHCALDAGINDSEANIGGQLEYVFRSCTIDGGPLGAISLVQPDRAYLDSCLVRHRIRFGAQSRSTFFEMNHCHLTSPGGQPGPIGVEILYAEINVNIRGNTFEGYEIPLQIPRVGASALLTGNTFIGPGRYGVHFAGPGESIQAEVYRNSFRGYDVGVHLENTPGPYGSSVSLYASDNRIEYCAAGVHVTGAYHVEFSRDTILSCGVGAILWATDTYATPTVIAERNVILSCGGNGMSIRAEDARIDSNVVGRCGGDGIVASIEPNVWWETIRLRRNTSFLNAGSGYDLSFTTGGLPGEIDHNVGYGNGRFGLEMDTTNPITLTCNDWFDNTLGAIQGIAPSPTDLTLDPLFCDLSQNDVRLAANSPLANPAGCGLIGALGIGCETTPVLVDQFIAWRNTEGRVVIGWRIRGDLAAEVRVERALVEQGPWLRVAGSPEADGPLLTIVDQEAEPGRSYWYRLIEEDPLAGSLVVAVTFVEAAGHAGGFALESTGGNPGPGPFLIRFRVPAPAPIDLQVFDLQGRRIAQLASGRWPAGAHTLPWSGRDAAGQPQTGLQLIRLRYPGGQVTQRLVLIR